MATQETQVEAGIVEHLPNHSRSTIVSDELCRIMAILQESCPPDAIISFHFDGKLHVHIDIRNMEYITGVEAVLRSSARACSMTSGVVLHPTALSPQDQRAGRKIGRRSQLAGAICTGLLCCKIAESGRRTTYDIADITMVATARQLQSH